MQIHYVWQVQKEIYLCIKYKYICTVDKRKYTVIVVVVLYNMYIIIFVIFPKTVQ